MTDRRQYLAIKFNPMQARTYTYSNDGPEVFPGDRVKVPARVDGWAAVTVESVSYDVPSFTCRAILGRVEDVPEQTADLREKAERATRTTPTNLKYDSRGPRGDAAQDTFDRDLHSSFGDDDEMPF